MGDGWEELGLLRRGRDGDCDEEAIVLDDVGLLVVDALSLGELRPSPVRGPVGKGVVMGLFGPEVLLAFERLNRKDEAKETLALPLFVLRARRLGRVGRRRGWVLVQRGQKRVSFLMGKWLGVEVERAELRTSHVSARSSYSLLTNENSHLVMTALRVEEDGPFATAKWRRLDHLGLCVGLGRVKHGLEAAEGLRDRVVRQRELLSWARQAGTRDSPIRIRLDVTEQQGHGGEQ